MTIKDLVPRFNRGRSLEQRGQGDPYLALQHEMNRLFDDFFGDFGLPPRHAWGGTNVALPGFSPRVDVSETDREIKISAELPGMDEKDIAVEMDDKAVTIRGERKAENEEHGESWYRREQSYGSFQRVVPLPATVNGDKAKAKFKKGLLTIVLPKREETRPRRRTVTIESD
jgi:HSP20 family protein